MATLSAFQNNTVLPYPRPQLPVQRQVESRHESHLTPVAGKRNIDVKGILGAAGLFGVGMLLHQLPARLPKDGLKTLLPSDWKVWARVLLGISAVHKLNNALDLELPPWLGALEAVAIINPLAVGFTLNNLKQTAVMAPLVAGVVQGASSLTDKISKPIDENMNVPPIFTRLLLSIGIGIGAVLTYPRIYKSIASTGIIGKELKEKAAQGGSAFASATFATCARGCSPGSFICLSEMADMVGGFSTWFKSHLGLQPATQGQSPTSENLNRPSQKED